MRHGINELSVLTYIKYSLGFWGCGGLFSLEKPPARIPINPNLFLSPDHYECVFGGFGIEIFTLALNLEALFGIEVYCGAV